MNLLPFFVQIWEASPFPKEKTKAPVAGPSAPHPSVFIRDDLAAAVEEGILEAARQASLEIRTEGAPQVDSWLRTLRLAVRQPAQALQDTVCTVLPTALADYSEILSSNCSKIKCNSSFRRWELKIFQDPHEV